MKWYVYNYPTWYGNTKIQMCEKNYTIESITFNFNSCVYSNKDYVDNDWKIYVSKNL